ncbi:NdvB protein [Vibrio sp. DW001]|uniref:GH36-type glycosyl hydrolase domain-containing protein n=1 Tax=Vibrio sp. DW001 TaxID=2912315 RepID=UPI0023B11B11|nr:amylo-alpha-1,6-glucosidase [Vibrio sp. DW001]WED26301.1 NdvB protein [Vibrio sp. DW001]
MSKFIDNGKRYVLSDPTLVPNSAGYLWNKKMMIHMNCQGYAVAQYMNPEPQKYAHTPNLAAKSFMQPEQPYFSHHPGRFFYVRDDDTGELFSAPFAPIKGELDYYEYSLGLSDIQWTIEKLNLRIHISLTLSPTQAAELWTVSIENLSSDKRTVSLIPYFPVGYMSWMNMGGHFDKSLNGIVCTSITPYQKVENYTQNKSLKDMTYLISDRTPDHYEIRMEAFEGQGGLHNPTALQKGLNLANCDSSYEMPICAMQYCLALQPSAREQINLVFGPALDKDEISTIKSLHLPLADDGQSYREYMALGQGVINIETPDNTLNHFINHWLPRQVFYHGDTHRLTTDPQTRNLLQDGMGMAYINPAACRKVILTALSQQHRNGEMPDGILLTPEAELKYINQVPHTDHGVWLPLILQAYLNETNDIQILHKNIEWKDSNENKSVLEHMNQAMFFMISSRDDRGLPYIAQGDWCDPMNMVGHKGKGVSGWLAQALSYSLQLWINISEKYNDHETLTYFSEVVEELKSTINTHLWQKDWYARGITDDGVTFGIPEDKEGRIYLNTQSWAMLANVADQSQRHAMLKAIDEQLDTPYGVMLFAPAYTQMREDVGRVTQKWPGSAENGSVYNHAAAFYAAGLYNITESDRAFDVVRKMLSDGDSFEQRGQLPIYIPNYYRGAYYQYPRTAGRSSNLFNTGTGSWVYRLVIEQMFGLKGCISGLEIKPQLPSHWGDVSAVRIFRGATFEVDYIAKQDIDNVVIYVDDQQLGTAIIENIEDGKKYRVTVHYPQSA